MEAKRKAGLDRFTWERAVTSGQGPPNSTTRHVLLTLGTHIRDGCAFPSQATLALEAALTPRSVNTHLQIAKKLGWIKWKSRKAQGKTWRHYIYTISLPDGFSNAGEPHSPPKRLDGGEPRSAPSALGGATRAEGAESRAHGGERDDSLVVNKFHINNAVKTVLNNSKNKAVYLEKEDEKTHQGVKYWAEKLRICQNQGEHDGAYQMRVVTAIEKHKKENSQ